MGYMTDFTLTFTQEKSKPEDAPVVKHIMKFFEKLDMKPEAAVALAKHLKPFLIEEKPKTIIDRLGEISGYESWYENRTGEWILQEAKWYEHEKNMLQLSKEFPSLTFNLHGEGEEQGDVWQEVYIGGVKQKRLKAKMVFEEESAYN